MEDNKKEILKQAIQNIKDGKYAETLGVLDPPAQYKLGNRYFNKHSKERDLDKAFLLFKSAAEQGFAPAMYMLAQCYSCAQGTGLNHEEGIKWYRKAAEAGYPMAEYELARLYLAGRDVDNNGFGPVEPDLKKMFCWFKRSAEHGLMFAQYKTALCLLDGRGTEKNEQEAI